MTVFKRSDNFIRQNGTIYKNTDELIKKQKLQRFENKIRKKVQSQFDLPDAKGVYLHEKSSVANAISKSDTYNDFINKNIERLKNGETIKNESLDFKFFQNLDLYNAFHYADILETRITPEGNIETYIFDTYDFNKNSSNSAVQIARQAQEGRAITPYYTIVKIVTKI